MTDVNRYGLVHISKPLKDIFNNLLDTAKSRQAERMKKIERKRKPILTDERQGVSSWN